MLFFLCMDYVGRVNMSLRTANIDLTIDKGDNSNTLVPTTVMHPDATAKRYS